MTASPPPAANDASDLVPVARYGGEGEAMERALVVLSMDSECAIDPSPEGGYEVLAEPEKAGRVSREISAYDAESSLPRPVERVAPTHAPGFPAAFVWAVSLMAAFLWQGQFPGAVDAFVSSPAALAPAGEWWRPWTSLFLHADLDHLLGNLGLGTLFGLWVGHSLGPWRGWFLMLLAGGIGNFLNILARRGEDFASLGASTAVFGALGLLTGAGLWHAIRHPARSGPMRPLVPLVAGLILLAWLGGGGPRTDVSAHLFGFVAGAGLAPVALALESARDR